MSTETAFYAWIVIAIVLVLANLINSFQWYKVIIKILRLKQRIQELEMENANLRKEK